MIDSRITCRRAAGIAVLLLVALGLHAPATASAQSTAPQCQAGPLVKIPDLPEASGIAVSRRVPGRLWAHNDSGQPVLIALDGKGAVTSRVRLTGAAVEDWEALAVGACPGGSCLYVGDIGDNDAKRKQITIYRVPEPAAGVDTAAVGDVFHATYPDGAHDAEALLVAPDGGLFVVTKGETGPIALYRFPREMKPGATVKLERLGAPGGAKVGQESRITDGAMSPDGQWTVLRTHATLSFYRTAELLAGDWREARRVDLASAREPQGEGVALGPDNAVYIVGEGGGKSQPGTFARFTCAAGE